MSGKAYTMKEMKVIVEYIVLLGAYSEVKGRKMWVEFANSNLTVRTWQSLKETFLKRILPDIHNPYYRLTLDQIRSFKEGNDVTEKETNKLELVDVNDATNSKANANSEENNAQQPSTSQTKNGEVTSGEEVTCSKVQNHDRDSVETVIIPTCYETAEDIQRALESPQSNTTNDKLNEGNNKTPPAKSLRDLITYSEPLTPMLQEVLHDFASDDDTNSGEARMQIVEDTNPDSELQELKQSPITIDSESQNVNENPPIEVLDSEDVVIEPVPDNNETEDIAPEESVDFQEPKVLSLKLKKRKGGYKIEKKKDAEKDTKRKSDDNTSTEAVTSTAPDQLVEDVSEICSTNENQAEKQVAPTVSVNEKTTSNLSNSADTILPNNQEALENSENNTNSGNQAESGTQKSKKAEITNNDAIKSKTRKRATSDDVSTSSKIKNNPLGPKLRKKATSDTDTIKKQLKLSKSRNLKAVEKQENSVNKTNEDQPPNPEPDSNTNNIVIEDKTPENEAPSDKVATDTSIDLSQINPCLKSVSLFAEQFNKVSYIESDEEAGTSKDLKEDRNKKDGSKEKIENVKEEVKVNKKKAGTTVNIMRDVVILKSHSESDSENNVVSPKQVNKPNIQISKSQRDKVLANMFGFSSGAVGPKRKRRVSHKKNSSYRYPRNNSSGDSSEWTSESDSESYVSPPHGRRNRHARKYLKPNSARIMSLEEEGGLFVMYGKKIYPLVKDGKIVKNYLTYLPESEEEDESYWKLKYVEEKKRVEELKKLVDHSQTNNARGKSPILPAQPINRPAGHEHRSPAKSVKNKICDQDPIIVPPKESSEEINNSGKTLKITFAKNNQEVHVEGHWSNIHPMLAEVVQIFNKDTEPTKERLNRFVDLARESSEARSEKSVAIVPIIDKVVHEKVNQIEKEIFKEIEIRDQEEQAEVKESTETNVTKRKRAPRAKRSSSSQSSVTQRSSTSSLSPKRLKTDPKEKTTVEQDTTTEQKPVEEKLPKPQPKSAGKKSPKTKNKAVGKKVKSEQKIEEKEAEVLDEQKATEVSKEIPTTPTASKSSIRTRRQTKTPKKDEKEAVTQTNTILTRKSMLSVTRPAEVDNDEDEVRYMFPPAKKTTRTSKTTLGLSKTRESKRYMADTPKIYSSPNFSLHSESTQGYQDSDISPPKALLRRKRKLSLTTALTKIRHRSYRNKRRSYPILTDDISSDSNSNIRPTHESSLKSEAYRSDSYQHLFPQNRNAFRPLQKIDENRLMVNETRLNISKTSAISNAYQKIDIIINNDFASSSNGVTDGGNSSNVSLPLSPELSIVENLSVSKEMISSLQSRPTLNELQAGQTTNDIRNKYLISQVDVSMPLMEQDCNFCPSLDDVIKIEHSLDEYGPSPITDSLVNKINIVNIKEAPSLSESLDTRLRNLLLESAKKMSICEENNNDVPKEIQKNTKSGKRCSTPRKKKDVQKRKSKTVEPVVEEECTETCSYSGRNSCPPAIQLITPTGNVSKENVDLNIEKDVTVEKKSRRKKDVIKVKILRPRSKTRSEVQTSKKTEDISVHNNDSGINETESAISNQGLEDSIDLIHNHSETCLHANECLADSIELVKSNARSIISLNTDSMTGTERSFRDQIVFQDCEDLPDFFCHNAQDRTNVNNNARKPSRTNTGQTSETEYQSPLSDSSLITDDLSDGTPKNQPTKWYLFSDDETQTAHNVQTKNAPSSSFGSSLKQIFPITCAVPDLSSITERSNENSRKPTLESDSSTRHDFDSQSTFY